MYNTIREGALTSRGRRSPGYGIVSSRGLCVVPSKQLEALEQQHIKSLVVLVARTTSRSAHRVGVGCILRTKVHHPKEGYIVEAGRSLDRLTRLSRGE